MPVSRNRKAKSNNNFKAKNTSIKPLHELLNLHINNCRGCGGKRDEFSFDELSDEQQVHWVKSGVINQIDYFLICSICNESSAIFKVDEH